jgi:GNAT superfamily N-acetyltransferase
MIKIRECRFEDKKDIDEISSLAWEGYDYLSGVFEKWLRDGNFFVAVENNKVIGTAKITLLPEKTGWLEGLRVHPEWRGKGIGRKLNDFTINLARDMRKSGKIDTIEFSTYFLNKESLHMTIKSGFKVVKSFFILYRKRDDTIKKPQKIQLSIDYLKEYRDYLPVGWRFIKKSENGYKYLKKMCNVYSTGKFKFYQAGHEETFVLLNGSKKAVKNYIPYLNSLSGNADTYDIMFPEEWGDKIPIFKENGYFLWEEPEEPNIYVLRDCSG